jgi:hypothetical protein
MDRLDRIERAIEKMQTRQLQIDKQLAKTDAQLAKTDIQLAKTDAQLAKTDAQLAKTDAQLAKTDAKLKDTSKILSNIGINLGHTAEEFFFYSLEENKKLGSILFDEIQMNVKAKVSKVQDEFDIVLYNGNTIGLVEIKHKVHPNDIENLATKKVDNFRILFPYYANYKIYLGIGGMSIPNNVAETAKKKGIALLRQKGQLTNIEAETMTAY